MGLYSGNHREGSSEYMWGADEVEAGARFGREVVRREVASCLGSPREVGRAPCSRSCEEKGAGMARRGVWWANGHIRRFGRDKGGRLVAVGGPVDLIVVLP